MLRAIIKYRPYEFTHRNMHDRNKIFRLLIIDKRDNSTSLHNIKTHTKNQHKNMRDNHAYHEVNSTYAQAEKMDDAMTNDFDDLVQTYNLAIVS